MSSEVPYVAVTIERREYGRRYTWLPVDTIDEYHFKILCDGTYMHPDMYDLRLDDVVRWKQQGRYVQGIISRVERTATALCASLSNVALLPPDFVEL